MPTENTEQVILVNADKYAKYILITALTCAFIVLALYFSNFNNGLSTKSSTWGEFGDFIGGTLNPFFGALSLFAILGTLIIQSRELSYSTKALQDQSKHLDLQAFENTFFSLIRLNNEIAKDLNLEDTEEDTNYSAGRGSFRILLGRLKATYDWVDKNESKNLDALEIVKEAYDQFYRKNQKFIGNYLNNLERILDFIDDRCPLEKSDYTQVVRAQLTSSELVLVFYHALSSEGLSALERLNQHNFFKNLPEDHLINPSLHGRFIERNINNGF